MKAIGRLWVLWLFSLPAMAGAADIRLDKAPVDLKDRVSLQRGAKLFTLYCLSCHSASYMRYNRLKDIGMSEEQIKKELPEGAKLGSTMQASMDKEAARQVYGVTPPDLSVISRSRGPDWIYTYLRSFYVDSSRPSGWNNLIFPNVGMPNMLAELQGEQRLVVENREGGEIRRLVLDKPGSMKPAEYDVAIADLTSYLVFMGEPVKLVRYNLGFIVLGFLFILFALIYALKREIWKDIH
ncbi:cytochrome c1 [Candidatus Ferrigenium straubiae]|jgi:ubiquinol-cytochrome c reductase cytochrome c1 subunit|uniref:cytochrome c1 n=1 Tax=Candidatus Ferrigenium straubiae TaxID=2919506 RepID=UPI003F4AF587